MVVIYDVLFEIPKNLQYCSQNGEDIFPKELEKSEDFSTKTDSVINKLEIPVERLYFDTDILVFVFVDFWVFIGPANKIKKEFFTMFSTNIFREWACKSQKCSFLFFTIFFLQNRPLYVLVQIVLNLVCHTY